MSEEERLAATAPSYDHDYGYAPVPQMRLVACGDPAQAEEEDLDYPIPYSEEKAQRWAREDPEFSIEEYRQDPYFTKANQAELRRAIADVKAGKTVTRTYVNGEWVFADA